MEKFLADAGDQCDSCGLRMEENHEFLSDTSKRIRWRFCSEGCAERGHTARSDKARFIGAVLRK